MSIGISGDNGEAVDESCTQATTHDLDQIWEWNHELPPTHSFCMHDRVSEQAQRLQDKVAVSSWDGNLTYTQVDHYSTTIACSLRQAGVQLHDVVPICFEKSQWTIVAVLAVMKVGATFVLMDPTLPLARLQNTAEQVDVKTILTSRKQHEFSASIMPGAQLFVVDLDTCTSSPDLQHSQRLPEVPPSVLMYIIFTSGSTGTPKGVMISHETYSSSALPRAKAVGYTEDSRVLDFASYAFDVSIDSMLLTLSNGGCLCIPSDEDRLNDINGVIRNMKVNYAGLTPSVARILDADVISSLSILGLGGEAVTARDVNRWGEVTRIVIGYGPCECTIGCTINSSAATGREYISIGRGNGACIWIVDPEDHEVLVPVGAIGELLVEGPIVGQGYLQDSVKTEAAFINDPSWLVSGHQERVGRRGRLYKSGDLVKYDPDGSGDIVFVGRKDTQVKLRGQRVELGEIEWQLHALLPPGTNAVAEVVSPERAGEQPMLMAFITSTSLKGQDSSNVRLELAEPVGELQIALSQVESNLAKILPRYMVPTVYIPVNYIPVMISGKTDRKQLRSFGATVDLQQLGPYTAQNTTRGLNNLERCLQRAWSHTLGLEEESIQPHSNFFALGGDSVAAMKLVSVCREQGLDLTVANAFRYPVLSAMAVLVQVLETQAHVELPAFSLISQAVEDACLEAARACQSDPRSIEDIYPCTPGQESLFTFSIKSTTPYVAQRLAHIPEHISLDDWKAAWQKVVAATPILRTRLVQSPDLGLRQVVLREQIDWRYATDLAHYLEQDRCERMDLGQTLARYAIIEDVNGSRRCMVWTIHHAVYDGWSEPLILRKVSRVLQNLQLEMPAQMKDLVCHLREVGEVSVQEFWRRELDGAIGPQFPNLPHRDYMPTANAKVERQFSFKMAAGSPFTAATYIRGALPLVVSQYTGSDDVVLSETLTGREISVIGIETIEGPLITTVPIRTRINRAGTVEAYLQIIQQSMAARSPYEHFGIQNIRRVSQDAQYACEARVGLVIQPKAEYTGNDLGFEQKDAVEEALKFNPYPIMLACEVQEEGLRVCTSFDDNLISTTQMERFLAQLETVCSQLTQGLDGRVGEISCISQVDLDQLWQWNKTPPLSFDEPSQMFQADQNTLTGSTYPPTIVPWVCDPLDSSRLVSIGCVGELWLEGSFLPGETCEAPVWLMGGSSRYAGRTSRVKSTGDLVRLREDGSLTFVGRKMDILCVQGHGVNMLDLQAQFGKHLPSEVQAAPAVFELPSSDIRHTPNCELIAFVEQQSHKDRAEGEIHLIPANHTIIYQTSDSQSREVVVCATTPFNLVDQLKELDRSLRNYLPPYMIPTTYIVVEKIPHGIDQSTLNQVASKIPSQVLTQLRETFEEAWTKSAMLAGLTSAESILRRAWAEVLKMNEEQIDLDDNFFRLGADSVLAMRLVSNLRLQGHILTVADIFQNMGLRDAATVLKINQASEQTIQPYKPFSTLGDLNMADFLSAVIQPKLADPAWSVQDVLPVTDMQALDVKATTQLPRTSVQYTMLYFDETVNKEQLHRACKKLINIHDVLRTVFVEHESTILQVVLKEVDAPIVMHEVEGEVEGCVADVCTQDIESEFCLGSLFLKLFHIDSKSGKSCLIIRLSHAQYDGTSLPMLLRDLETLYTGGQVVDYEPFSAYVAQICDVNTQTAATSYWRNLLDGSSPCVIPMQTAQAIDKSIFLEQPVSLSQRPIEITLANLIAAAWALVLARRLQTSDVTFGGVTSGRRLDMANADRVIGPCYQFAPIRISIQPHWTAMDLMQFVQRQSAESAPYDFLGYQKILKQCTNWPIGTQRISSIVHHQDFEDFDTMSFAGGSCRVDISNPHGDAAYPLKVASYCREGQLHVGIVGSENERGLVQTLLSDVVAAIQELSEEQSKLTLLHSAAAVAIKPP